MSRPIRYQPEEWSVFFVTGRCIHSRARYHTNITLLVFVGHLACSQSFQNIRPAPNPVNACLPARPGPVAVQADDEYVRGRFHE